MRAIDVKPHLTLATESREVDDRHHDTGGCGDVRHLDDASSTGHQLTDPRNIAGRITRASEDGFAIEFIDADPLRDALVRKLYSGRYYEGRRQVQSKRLFRAVLARALR